MFATLNERMLVGAALLLSCAAACAETLAEAWTLALQNDHALAAVRLETEASRLEVSAARAQRWPTFTASGGFMQFQDAPAFDFSAAGVPLQLPEIIDDDNTVVGSMTMTLPLYTGGRISSAIDAANEDQRAREAGERQAVQDVKLAVAHAYVDVLRAQRALAVADSNTSSLEAYAAEVTSMFDRELVPRNDLLAAQVALANARQNRIRLANAVSLARAAYNRRLGQPLMREATLEASLPTIGGEFDREPVETLIEHALGKRPEIAVLEAQAKEIGHLASVERARLRPSVLLSGGYSYLENQALDREEFAIASIGFQWPLFDGGVTRNRTAALRRGQLALEQRRDDLESLVALEVRQAWLDSQDARSRVGVTAEAVAQSEENLRITRRQYQAGLVISTRVLEAESLRVVSRMNYDDAALDASLAMYRLARVAGEL
ncbi:MAG TPA: TolC family protein [Steroidobacter sp.]|jgi:outer membrane protein TolC|nr:TolC family protein [Steroidobacter sp.]